MEFFVENALMFAVAFGIGGIIIRVVGAQFVDVGTLMDTAMNSMESFMEDGKMLSFKQPLIFRILGWLVTGCWVGALISAGTWVSTII